MPLWRAGSNEKTCFDGGDLWPNRGRAASVRQIGIPGLHEGQCRRSLIGRHVAMRGAGANRNRRQIMAVSLATPPAEDKPNPFADGAAFIDGQYVPIREAKISVLDWGF